MSAPSHKISLPRIILVWCQTRLASGAGKAHTKKNLFQTTRETESWQLLKSDFQHLISENGLILCIPRTVAVQYIAPVAMKTHGRGRARGERQIVSTSRQLNGRRGKKRSSNSFYGRKEARCTFSTPLLSRVDRALEVRQLRLKDASTSVGVRGRREGNPPSPLILFNISHLI